VQRSKLISYIKHPELLEDLSFEELQRWVAEFPYSQNLRTLLAKKVIDEGLEDKHADVLHDAGLYSSDRSKLYDTINADQKDKIEEETDAEMELETNAEAPTFMEKLVAASSIAGIATDPVDGGINTQSDPVPSVEPNHEEIEEISVQDEMPVSEHISEEIHGEQTVNELEIENVEMERSDPNLSEEANELKVGLSSFSQWLLELEQNNDEESDEYSDDGVISESLAKILESQGHTHKAVKMYDKLSLKYPEKSGYFAAQIEKITS